MGLVLPAGERGQHDGRQVPAAALLHAAQLAHQLVAVLAGHADVADQHVEAALLKRRQRQRAAAGHAHGRTAVAQDDLQHAGSVGIVVHHQQAQAGQRRLAAIAFGR